MASTDFTPHLGLPYLLSNQAQKHVTLNESLRALDEIVHLAVKDKTLSVPPGMPEEGARYVIASTASGDWAGQDGKLACYVDGGWLFFEPKAGWRLYDESTGQLEVYNGSNWRPFQSDELQNLTLIGLGGTADANNPLLARLNNALLTAQEAAYGGSGDLRFKLNKEASGNVLSVLLQTNYSTRAELGLVGDDDLVLKVSPDGATFYEGVRIDKATGAVRFPCGSPDLRDILSADRAYYVDAAAGDDGNDGLSSGAAFETIQKAVDTALALDMSVYGASIYLADGSYAPFSVGIAPVGGTSLSIIGNTSAPGNVVVDRVTIDVAFPISLQGMKIETTGTTGLSLSGRASVEILAPFEFGNAGSYQITMVEGANLTAHSYDIVDDANIHLFARDHATILCTGSVTVSGAGSFDFPVFIKLQQFAYCRYSPTLSGSATGKRYVVDTNSILNTNGGGASFLPGDTAGTTASQGQYL